MKRKLISFCLVALFGIAGARGGLTLTVPEVSIARGGTSNVVIYFDFGTQPYTAYQFDIAYPEGISSVADGEGCPSFIPGDIYTTEHVVSSIYTPQGLDRFQCFSPGSKPFTAQSGTLLILPVKAQKNLAEGTYQATISPIEFVQTDATPDRPEPVTFNIIVNSQVVLDETSTLSPAAASGVEAVVRRTIKADEWSTLCLPFAMTEAQVKEAFGNDVKLADFTGTETEHDASEHVKGITVNFESTNAIEANHPYIIKVSQPVSEFMVSGVDVVPDEEAACIEFDNGRTDSRRIVYSGFYGTYRAGTVLNKYTLFLHDNLFWYSTGETKMKAFRAYFDFLDVLTEVEEAGVKILAVIDGMATSIGSLAPALPLGEEATYNLAGQRVGKSYKGIVVENGRKTIK